MEPNDFEQRARRALQRAQAFIDAEAEAWRPVAAEGRAAEAAALRRLVLAAAAARLDARCEAAAATLLAPARREYRRTLGLDGASEG
jgi:hypothetical protein